MFSIKISNAIVRWSAEMFNTLRLLIDGWLNDEMTQAIIVIALQLQYVLLLEQPTK